VKKLALVFLLLAACDQSPALLTDEDAGSDAGMVPDAIEIDVANDAGATITGITMSPLALVPPFSPDTHDYYVRCASGDNTGTLDVSLSDGSSSQSAYDVVEDQAVVVGNTYWIRCLPHDFPVIGVTKNGTPTPGYYLVNATSYAVVLDTNGTPVWYTRGLLVLNVDSQATNTITLEPNATAPYGFDPETRFDVHALDTTQLSYVAASNAATDGHELRVLPNGDFLLVTFPIETGVDLSGLGAYGQSENMADCQVQEVDAQGNLVWSWLASDHVDPVHESVEQAVNTILGKSVIDVFHCNAIDVGPNNDLLVSSRHANALFDIDRTSGKILWKLGGTAYNKDGAELITPDDAFNMQHDARFTATGHVTLFDDHGANPGVGVGVARGAEYSIDHGSHTATLVFHYDGVAQAQYEGSFRRYPDGHAVIGWGFITNQKRVFTEIDEANNDVLDVTFSDVPSYRAVKVPLTQLDIGLLRATAGQ
jgi:hypothetical protein